MVTVTGTTNTNQPPTAAFTATPTNGTAPLRVAVDASASSDADGSISAYSWAFGDGGSAAGAVNEHTYAVAGNYTLTLTVRDNNGAETSTTRQIQVSASGTNGLLFFDDFNYAVNNETTPEAMTRNYNAFRAAGWQHAKAINTTGSYLGNLYTTTSIPGYRGSFPGRNSTRALVIEAQQSLREYPANQTDFYLQYGGGGANDPVVLPGSVWFQFWMYVPHTAAQPSWFARGGKFLYPTNCSWPSTCNKQMAEGWMRHLGSAWVEAQSAGIEAHGQNPRALAVMREAGVDISNQQSKRLTPEQLTWADLVVTVCGHAHEHCPALPAGTNKLHWPLPDPARAQGTNAEMLAVFRAARDDIRGRVAQLIEQWRSSKVAVA